MRQTIYGEEYAHLHIAEALSNLGVAYRQQGKIEEAVKTHEGRL